MKKYCLLLVVCSMSICAVAQVKNTSLAIPDTGKKILIAEAACGECQFKMRGDDCDLAVRINGVSYFVDGTDIDAHGDAHGEDGFCNTVRMANVQGEVKGGRFAATYFQLLSAQAAGDSVKGR